MEERARNSSDLIAGGVQDRDLIRTEQAHIEVARLRERETGRLGRGLRRVEWELVHQLEIRCRRMVDQANSVDQSRERVVERHRDGEVQPLARRIDPPAEWPAREAEEAGQPGIGEPDRGHAIGSDTPDPGLVVGHVEVSRPVEHEVVPHRLHPVATEARAGGHLGEHLGGGGVLAEVEAEHPEARHVVVLDVVDQAEGELAVAGADAVGGLQRVRDDRRLLRTKNS